MDNDWIYPLLLERYVLGELTPDQMQQVKVALEKSETLREQFETICQSNKSILEKYPIDDTVREINLRLTTNKVHSAISKQQLHAPHWYHNKHVYITIIATCVLMIIPIKLHFNQLINDNDDSLHLKGMHSHLSVYMKIKQKPWVEQLKNFDEVQKGDLLQVAYVSEGNLFGTIVSLDGNGIVTLHFPDSLSGSCRLESSGEKLLTKAYELDNAPGFEHFFFVTAKDSFDVSLVVNAVKRFSKHPDAAGKACVLELPEHFGQHELILRKDTQ